MRHPLVAIHVLREIELELRRPTKRRIGGPNPLTDRSDGGAVTTAALIRYSFRLTRRARRQREHADHHREVSGGAYAPPDSDEHHDLPYPRQVSVAFDPPVSQA